MVQGLYHQVVQGLKLSVSLSDARFEKFLYHQVTQTFLFAVELLWFGLGFTWSIVTVSSLVVRYWECPLIEFPLYSQVLMEVKEWGG